VLIPNSWIQSAINAHVRLGITPSGIRRGALDLADEGADRNAAAFRYGVLLEHVESWSGKGGSIYASVVRMFHLCDERRFETFDFDSDGLGAGARGDSERVNSDRTAAERPALRTYPFRGSGAVVDPDSEAIRGSGRLNRDYYANAKSQGWMALRKRFEQTHATVVEGRQVDPDSIISLAPTSPSCRSCAQNWTRSRSG
jgi:phage terminase large subunit